MWQQNAKAYLEHQLITSIFRRLFKVSCENVGPFAVLNIIDEIKWFSGVYRVRAQLVFWKYFHFKHFIAIEIKYLQSSEILRTNNKIYQQAIRILS